MGIQIDIFGSFVSRDIMRYVQQDSFILNRCIGEIPISSLFDKPLLVDQDKIASANISQYDKRMMLIQLNRNALELLKKSKSSVLLIDLASECMNRIIFNDGNNTSVAYSDSMEKNLNEIFGDIGLSFQKISPLALDLQVMEKKYSRFAKSIVKTSANPNGYEEENIIVVEAYCSEFYICNKDAVLHRHDAKYKIQEMNTMLKNLYMLLYKNLPRCKVIKMPTFTHSTENHIRDFGPLFYTDDTYQYMADSLEVLCGISKKNSVDNLYQERCVQNFLRTRLMNYIFLFNKVDTMQNEIGTLKNQVQELQKQINVLQNRKNTFS